MRFKENISFIPDSGAINDYSKNKSTNDINYLRKLDSVTDCGILATNILVTFLAGVLISSCKQENISTEFFMLLKIK